MSPDPPLVREDRRLTDRCSLSMPGLVCYRNSPECSTMCTNPTTFLNLRSSSQTSSSTQVGVPARIPFSWIDGILDAYDVNVSPDKRTILLHEQNSMLESLRVRSSIFALLMCYLTSAGCLGGSLRETGSDRAPKSKTVFSASLVQATDGQPSKSKRRGRCAFRN